ncbi:MAG: hypothetical protein LAE24_05025 [Candidatus Contendobacter sp.]|nr:hypothetical protein [Candidatus Contendobacter sp.]
MQLTFDVPDGLAAKISIAPKGLSHIFMLGLRELDAENLIEFKGFSDTLEFLANLPTPQEILALHPSPALQEEMERLLEKSQDKGLNSEEEAQWRRLEYLEHLIRKAKIRAAQRLAKP